METVTILITFAKRISISSSKPGYCKRSSHYKLYGLCYPRGFQFLIGAETLSKLYVVQKFYFVAPEKNGRNLNIRRCNSKRNHIDDQIIQRMIRKIKINNRNKAIVYTNYVIYRCTRRGENPKKSILSSPKQQTSSYLKIGRIFSIHPKKTKILEKGRFVKNTYRNRTIINVQRKEDNF